MYRESIDRETLAGMIDQTLLKPTAGRDAALEWMEANRDAGFASLCVSPFLVPLAAQILAGRSTRVCAVVGFPLGFALTETKAAEARRLIELGANEIDMVLNIAALIEGDDAFVTSDIAAVALATCETSIGDYVVKVILETGYLTPEQITRASRLAVASGAHFVKTSTGFGPRGASTADVRLMRAAVGDEAGVKASGGIRDLSSAMSMIEAGATRIGTSSGLEILEEFDRSPLGVASGASEKRAGR